MRVALVHEYITHFGGAERVLQALMELYPNAPVFTLVHDKERVEIPIDASRVHTSWLQRLPGAQRHHRYFPLLMPLAVEHLDISPYDVVISDSHSFGKGIIVGPNTLHISYCFTPTRYAWDDSHRYVREFSRSRVFQRFAPIALSYIRLWDEFAAQRVDTYVTLSHYVAGRIRKYYRRRASVIYPPVDISRFSIRDDHDGYYLVVSRLLPYKRIDLAIDACERLGRPLKIAGVGPELEDLKKRSSTCEFLGFVPDDQLPRLYAGARALLFPQEEDFGITPLEAAACGKPTIAYNAGGARETIIPGVTGMFFDHQTVRDLCSKILEFENTHFISSTIRRHATQYDRSHFLQNMAAFVQNEWMRFNKRL